MAGLEATAASAFQPIVYSAEELDSIRATKAELVKRGVPEDSIGLKGLALTVVNSKCRVDEAADKYVKWTTSVAKFGVASIDDALWKEDCAHMLRSYAPCGVDREGRSIFWIKGDTPVQIDEESASVKAGLMYFMAIHADNVSFHEGISFVIDVAQQPSAKVGNEQKMQNTWQAFPLRPQRIFISGAGQIKRLFINTILKVASFFMKQKILDRIRFATLDEVLAEVPLSGAPVYVGGKGGGVVDMGAWVKTRLEQFTVPEL